MIPDVTLQALRANDTRLTRMTLDPVRGNVFCAGPGDLHRRRAAGWSPPGAESAAAWAAAEAAAPDDVNFDDRFGGDEGASKLADALAHNTTLVCLDLDDDRCGRIEDAGASRLAEMLTTNTTLVELHLQCNPIKSAGLCSLAEALGRNSTLQTLVSSCSPESPPHITPGEYVRVVDAFARALTHNTTLNCLHLDPPEDPDDPLWEDSENEDSENEGAMLEQARSVYRAALLEGAARLGEVLRTRPSATSRGFDLAGIFLCPAAAALCGQPCPACARPDCDASTFCSHPDNPQRFDLPLSFGSTPAARCEESGHMCNLEIIGALRIARRQQRCTAFAMVLHDRLGASSPYQGLEPGVLHKICLLAAD